MFSKSIHIDNHKEGINWFLYFTENIVKSDDWYSSKDLYSKIFNKGKKIVRKYGRNTKLVFIILKVLKMIRVECAEVLSGNAELEDQTTNLFFAESNIEVKEVLREDLKDLLMEALGELNAELEEAELLIQESAINHIENEDIIMTYGYSKLVLSFMKYAKENGSNFNVIVLEGYPLEGASQMAMELADLDIQVTVAPARSSFTLLSKIHKVILKPHTAFVNGDLSCKSDIDRICMDAKANAVPVYMLLPSFLLSPLLSINVMDNLPIYNADNINGNNNDNIDNISYTNAIVSGELIDTLITNLGPLHTTHLLSLSRDCFCAQDVRDLLEVMI